MSADPLALSTALELRNRYEDGGLDPAGDVELEDPVERQPAAVGAAAVEPEGEFVEVGRQVSGFHRALVGAQQPAFEQ